jgi:manganese/zinc/iron transport system substrate-binding protein
MKFRFSGCLILSVLLALLSGCATKSPNGGSSASPAARQYPYKVVATTGMVGDIVKAVAGDKATVETLIGEGVDPHLFKPTRADVGRLAGADIVFYSGHLLEGKMTDVLVKISSQRPVHAVTEGVDPSFVLEPPDFAGHADPHMWMDVKGWMAAVGVVKDSLIAFDPANKESYDQNTAAYLEQLAQLDAYALEAFSSVPAEKRVLVTAHDAFNYMGRAYNLEVRGIQGLSTESEAGLADLNALVNFLVERKIEAVFVETSVAEKNVNALIEGATAKGAKVTIGGKLFSDAMGAAGTYEGTYVGMIDHNVTVIVRALGGQAPEKGFQGKLGAKP